MSTLIPNSEDHAAAQYAEAEASSRRMLKPTAAPGSTSGSALLGLVAVIAALIAVVALATGNSEPQPVAAAPTAPTPITPPRRPPPPPRPPPKRRA